jgi:hypothetical protein
MKEQMHVMNVHFENWKYKYKALQERFLETEQIEKKLTEKGLFSFMFSYGIFRFYV